jgi:glycosyltransferase involved in cell wall biosynthesis
MSHTGPGQDERSRGGATRIALVSSEPIRERMAGIGIRYLELARRLPGLFAVDDGPAEAGRVGAQIEVVVVSPAEPERTAALGIARERVRRFEAGRLAEILADCDGAVAQGQLANHLVLECPRLPTAIDLYDPWLVENLHYTGSLGLDPYRNDHASWVLQLSRGDFFLCSSEEQRLFYLGFLAALGRVNPERTAADPDLNGLIAPVPFGVPTEVPDHRPLLPERRPGERRLLFGGLYDWYDPWVLLDALERLDAREARGVDGLDWTLLLVRNPNPESTPQRLLREVEERCRRRGWWETRVRVLDWVPAERRWDLLRDADVLVAPHRASLETRLSLRTRFLDALAVGCPVITSEGGTMARLLREHDAGRVIAEGDSEALAEALAEALRTPSVGDAARELDRVAVREGARGLLEAFRWERVLEPLVRFCRAPVTDPTKERYAFRPPTVAPPDRPGFRLRRGMRRLLRRLPGRRFATLSGDRAGGGTGGEIP